MPAAQCVTRSLCKQSKPVAAVDHHNRAKTGPGDSDVQGLTDIRMQDTQGVWETEIICDIITDSGPVQRPPTQTTAAQPIVPSVIPYRGARANWLNWKPRDLRLWRFCCPLYGLFIRQQEIVFIGGR